MFSVLIALDGKIIMEDVAWQTGMSLGDLWTIIIKLVKLKLIAQVVQKVDIVDENFLIISFLFYRLPSDHWGKLL